MANLIAILRQGATSLAAHRAATATASNNIANVNTPGYARQRVELEAQLPIERVGGGFVGGGVYVGSITQSRDRFVEAQLPSAFGLAARSGAEAEALASVQALDPRAGLTDALSNFYASLRQLSQNPGDISLRQNVLGSAATLGLSFNRAAQSLTDARGGLDSQVNGSVAEINALTREVANLNKSIGAARATGAEPNDLLDARLKATDRLAELTGAKPIMTNDGSVTLTLARGTPLVSGGMAATVSATPDPANAGHFTLSVSRPDGSTPTPVVDGWGGQVGGWLSARDGAIKSAQDQLDTLAYDLTGAVNAAHQAGVGLDGASGRNLLDAGGSTAGAASRLAVSVDVAGNPRRIGAAGPGGASGDASALLAVVATENQALSSGMTAGSSLAQTISQFGAATFTARAMSDQDGALKNHLTSLRESASGVSVDEELVNLTQAQRAYEAVTKVIQTTDQMLDTLMQLKST